MPLQLKIETIAKEMYGAKSVEFNENILNKLNTYESKVLIKCHIHLIISHIHYANQNTFSII